jgi:hypothetical protein
MFKVNDRVISICPAYYIGESGIVKGSLPNGFVVLLDSGQCANFLPEEMMLETDMLSSVILSKDMSQDWKREGKCPCCGSLGRYHMSVPICEKHGPY